MRALFEPMSAKQQMSKIGLGFVVLTPMMLIAAFWRHSYMAQHFGAVTTLSMIAVTSLSVSSRSWLQKIK
jgi:hypothetical protein